MMSLRLRAALIGFAMTGAIAACSSTWVVVPPPSDGYSSADTLRGYLDGDEVRVVFRFDTITSTRVVTRTDTVFTEGADTVFKVEELLRVDTVAVTDTLRISDTAVRIDSILRVDTVLRADTVRLTTTDTLRLATTDTVRLTTTDTLRLATTDTVLVTRTDTVLVPRTDTLRIPMTDTVRVAVADTVLRTDTVTVTVPGRRFMFVPPGHHPPDGECRVWIHGVPPGQQARATQCDALGSVPASAFILFGGDAWDFDYDWLAAVGRGEDAPPPEILALKRNGQGR